VPVFAAAVKGHLRARPPGSTARSAARSPGASSAPSSAAGA